ncbi:MAG: T9SS type A sorting domain-containing protein, partial [Bacteroidota bacterium]|nr:T9SS type A sorting domain-containing protein [Bacteroidota bacterium]
ATEASIVGPKGCYVKSASTTDGNGNDLFEASTMPWPSDHKAVTATINFSIAPSAINSVPNSNATIRVFPNPTAGQLNLISPESKKVNVSILKTSGGKVLTKKLDLLADQSALVNISGIPSGIYLLTVVSRDQSQVIKLIKQ